MPKKDIDLLAEQNGLDAEQTEEAAQRWIASVDRTSLNEVVIEKIPVAMVEYIVEEYVDEGGVKRKRNKSYVRHTEILAYVPNDVFYSVAASYQDIQPLMQSKQKEDQAQAMQWTLARVLEIWQLTEEDMTEQRLRKGLSMQQTQALFKRFFAQLTLTVAQSQA